MQLEAHITKTPSGRPFFTNGHSIMSISGVAVDDEVVEVFQDIKIKKLYQYIIFGMSDDLRTIVVRKHVDKVSEGSEEEKWCNFLKDLPPLECLWAVYDMEYDLGESGTRNKLVFVPW